jgi:bifunctional DNase/RNase
MLFYLEGFSVAEASVLLGLTENAFKVRLSKARQTLRQMFAAQPAASLHHQHLHPHQNIKHSRMSEEKQMIPIKVVDVIPYQWEVEGQEPHTAHQLVLFDETHHRAVVIWIGPAEGNAIAARLNGQEFPRPMTHVLMARLLEASGAAVESVTISTLKEDVYYATVNVRVDGQIQAVDARPSDAIALAVQLEAPLYAAEDVLANHGVVLPANAAPTGAGLKAIADVTEAQVKAVQSRTEERKAQLPEDREAMAREVVEKAFNVSLAS